MAGQVRRVTGFAPDGGYTYAPLETQSVAGPAPKTTKMLTPGQMQLQTMSATSAPPPSGPIRATGFDHINPGGGGATGAPVPPGWPGLSNTVTGGTSQQVPPGWGGLYQTLGSQQPGGGVQTTPFNGTNSGGGVSQVSAAANQGNNPLAPFTDLFGQMLTSYQGAYDDYRGDVENRYQDVTGGFLRRAGMGSGYAQGLQDDVLTGYENRYQRGMDTVEQLGGQEKADVNQRYNQLQAQTNQDLTSRGLTGTTIKPTMTLGNERERQDALSRVNERLMRERLGTDADLSGQALAAQLGLGQYVNDTTSGLSGDALNWMGSRNDVPPDMQGLMALGQMLGPALAGSMGLGGQQGGGAAGMPSYMLPGMGAGGGNPYQSPFNPGAVQYPQSGGGGGGGGGMRPGGGAGGLSGAGQGGGMPGGQSGAGTPGGPWGQLPLPGGTAGRQEAKKKVAEALGIPEDQVTPQMVDDYIAGNPVAPAGAGPSGSDPMGGGGGIGSLAALAALQGISGTLSPEYLAQLVASMPQDPFLAAQRMQVWPDGPPPSMFPPQLGQMGGGQQGGGQIAGPGAPGGQWPGLPLLNQ